MNSTIQYEILELIKCELINKGIDSNLITLKGHRFPQIIVNSFPQIFDHHNMHLWAFVGGPYINVGCSAPDAGKHARSFESMRLADPNVFDKVCDRIVEMYKTNFKQNQ